MIELNSTVLVGTPTCRFLLGSYCSVTTTVTHLYSRPERSSSSRVKLGPAAADDVRAAVAGVLPPAAGSMVELAGQGLIWILILSSLFVIACFSPFGVAQ